MVKSLALWCAGSTLAAGQGDWTPPAEVRHDDVLCVSYQARLDGPFLVVRATVGSGWHTFAMDNKKRAEEKLAGAPALSIDRPTEIALSGGLAVAGPWFQSPPADFSRPALRWFSWGFDSQALFVAKVRRVAASPARIAVRGQACTESICKNIDVSLSLPLPAGDTQTRSSGLEWKALVQVGQEENRPKSGT